MSGAAFLILPPVWVLCFGFVVAVLAAVEWQYTRHWTKIVAAGNPAQVAYTRRLFLLCCLFDRRKAKWVHFVCEYEWPRFLLVPVIWLGSKVFGIRIHEASKPFYTYRTIGDWFSRELKEGIRHIDSVPGGIVSPVDGRVLAVGSVSTCGRVAQVEVKGTTFSLAGLLGCDPSKVLAAGDVLRYIVFHLGPGDYHRFHSPTDFTIVDGRRFAGEGLPVAPIVTGLASDVFSLNERLVLSGEWEGKQMHLAAIGAAHVRGIFLEFDKDFGRKLGSLPSSVGGYYLDGQATYAHRDTSVAPAPVAAGEMLGGFRLGSAVVLVFASSGGSGWLVDSGDKVRVGQQLFSGKV